MPKAKSRTKINHNEINLIVIVYFHLINKVNRYWTYIMHYAIYIIFLLFFAFSTIYYEIYFLLHRIK